MRRTMTHGQPRAGARHDNQANDYRWCNNRGAFRAYCMSIFFIYGPSTLAAWWT